MKAGMRHITNKKNEGDVSLKNETSLLEISVCKGNQASSVEEETGFDPLRHWVSLLKSIKDH